ncbi:leucine-rich repeat-containing protein 74B-like [Physella acuta]|uniref:leucine-rich repeat-containing protein 74B-like n=1 Tax=Physella acuta TaxID=109671 RepID=UPI0027DBE132|nr:leucine-rich repeat-containing protein 74B-like [Physella acuta]
MEKQMAAIRMHRHLRAQTAGPKHKQGIGVKEIRPDTAVVKPNTEQRHDFRKVITYSSTQKSFLRAPGKTVHQTEAPPDSSSPDVDQTCLSRVEPDLEQDEAVSEINDSLLPELSTVEDEPLKEEITPIPAPALTLEAWITGSPHSSREFDTDTEPEVSNRTTTLAKKDQSGKLEYEEQCKKHGIIPVSFLCRHLGEKNVKLKHRSLGSSGIKPLALALRHNTLTENLDLTGNNIDGIGVFYLAKMLEENQTLISLNLSNNCIGSLEALSNMLEINTTLKLLSVSGNHLGDSATFCLINSLKNNMSLLCLDLSYNGFSLMGGVHLGKALGINDGLLEINLSWNSLRNQGALAIANALKMNRTLEVLDLSWNGLALDGAIAIQRALQVNKTLKVLDLTNNRLDSKAAAKLAFGLRKNTSLQTLILNTNPLGEKGVASILKSISKHPAIIFLSLEDVTGTSSHVELIQTLERDKDMVIAYDVLNNINKITVLFNLNKVFNLFKRKQLSSLEDNFIQCDPMRSGKLDVDKMKLSLRCSGINLTHVR